MKCLMKNRECPHAGRMIVEGFPEWGEKEGLREYTVCYNDEINRDPTKCK